MNSEHLVTRARLLLQQQRFEQAEELLRQALVESPDSGAVHSLLACSLKRDRDQLPAAFAAAQRGVHLARDYPYSHFAMAAVLEARNQNQEALASIQEAIGLAPLDADFHGFRSQLMIKLQRWKEALESAVTGLRLDPEHAACAAARVLALERLGRVSDALREAERAVRNEPDSSEAHAGRGWALLQAGRHHEAQVAFREALRLDPSSEFARYGMITALNRSNLIFRVFDSLMTRIGRMSGQMQWVLILGLFFGVRMLNSLAQPHTWLKPYILPVTLAYLLFVMMSWIMQPLPGVLFRRSSVDCSATSVLKVLGGLRTRNKLEHDQQGAMV